MFLNTDVNPEWAPDDFALFVGLVGTIQNAIHATTHTHQRRIDDPTVQDLIARALLVAMKSEHISDGLRRRDVAEAFIEYEARLRAEIVDLPQAKRSFNASLHVAGRA